MTKAEIGMLVIVLLFGACLVMGMRFIAAGNLETMTFWTAGIMGIMAVYGLIAAYGIRSDK